MLARELNLAALEEGYARLRVRDRRAEARLLLSLEAHGQQSPIWVVARDEGRYLVIDGHKRVRGLRRLRHDVVALDEAPPVVRDDRPGRLAGEDLKRCPVCKVGTMRAVAELPKMPIVLWPHFPYPLPRLDSS